MRRLASLALVALALVAGCVSTLPAESTAAVSLAPGSDAPRSVVAPDGSIELRLESVAGGTVRFDEVARVSYHGNAPATVLLRLLGGPEWRIPRDALVEMRPGEVVRIPLEIALLEGQADVSPATLTAQVTLGA